MEEEFKKYGKGIKAEKVNHCKNYLFILKRFKVLLKTINKIVSDK